MNYSKIKKPRKKSKYTSTDKTKKEFSNPKVSQRKQQD